MTASILKQRFEHIKGLKLIKERNLLSSPSHFSLFHSCLSVVLLLYKGDYPENLDVVFCP